LGFDTYEAFRDSIAERVSTLKLRNPFYMEDFLQHGSAASSTISPAELKERGGSLNIFNTGRTLELEKHSCFTYSHVILYLYFEGIPLGQSDYSTTHSGLEALLESSDTAAQANLYEAAFQHVFIHVLGYEYGERMFSSVYRSANRMSPDLNGTFLTGIVVFPDCFKNPTGRDTNPVQRYPAVAGGRSANRHESADEGVDATADDDDYAKKPKAKDSDDSDDSDFEQRTRHAMINSMNSVDPNCSPRRVSLDKKRKAKDSDDDYAKKPKAKDSDDSDDSDFEQRTRHAMINSMNSVDPNCSPRRVSLDKKCRVSLDKKPKAKDSDDDDDYESEESDESEE
jgi:hypothetical protein